ncbi:type II secretion system F family protein [Zobellella maritima]|uniref:type II secretion system F family protein n=1 Tax=Zobellella maritima TaxID=2059725 RepID=UPI000E306A09|nr:type II secretion system F family protein [Zobellella maritima]
MELPMLFGLISLVLLLAGLMLLWRSRFQARAEAVALRLVKDQEEVDQGKLGRIEKEKLRAGISLPFWLAAVLLFGWLCLLFVVFELGGFRLLLAVSFGSLLTARLYLSFRYRWRVKKMVSQLPQMLEHMIRSTQSGRTLGDALLLAMDVAPHPLRQGMGRSRRFIERGGRLGDAMDSFAELYEQQEFRLLALGVRVNQRYGGSATELLQNLIILIREREKASSQLRAMTGETRISALVLGGMPLAMAAYIFISNPGFLMGLWLDPAGKLILLGALLFQVVGSLFLWRMLRSI